MKKKILWITAAAAVTSACMVMGTFAWQSINQEATNKAVRLKNPGGRLHDDFNGENKDIYIENYREKDDGSVIYARIRLDEYLEIGKGAGEDPDSGDPDAKTAQSIISGAEYDDVTTWYTHNPYDHEEPFHTYFQWTEGGQTKYMPTFNKDNESLKADINGTLEGDHTGTPYNDYEDYSVKTTETAYEIQDGGIQDAVQKTHTAKDTENAQVMTMGQWKAMGSPQGAYWVYDTDGWAYWATGIQPETATGCLINEIKPKSSLQDDYFYGINVVCQIVTAGEWKADEENDEYYFAEKGGGDKESATRNAIYLLEIASGAEKIIKIRPETSVEQVNPGSQLQLKADVTLGRLKLSEESVIWSVSGKTSSTTTIDSSTGLLQVGTDEVSKTLTVKAVLRSDSSVKNEYTVYTNAPEYTVTVSPKESIAERMNIAVQGNKKTFSAVVTRDDGESAVQNVTWKISQALDADGNPTTKASGTTIAGGILTVDANETAKQLEITAISTLDKSIAGSYTVDVLTQFEYIPYIQVGSIETVYIDGYHWYVLAYDRSDDKYLLWSKESPEGKKDRLFASTNPLYTVFSDYRMSTWHEYLNENYRTLTPTLSQYIKQTTLTTVRFDGTGYESYGCYMFLLSSADYFGTSVNEQSADAREYTYNEQKIVTSEIMQDVYDGGLDVTWTRSINTLDPYYWWGAVDNQNKKVLQYSCSTSTSNTQKAYGQMALWVEVK